LNFIATTGGSTAADHPTTRREIDGSNPAVARRRRNRRRKIVFDEIEGGRRNVISAEVWNSRGMYYKTFYGRNLQMFVIS
jgi:hypothetical protein